MYHYSINTMVIVMVVIYTTVRHYWLLNCWKGIQRILTLTVTAIVTVTGTATVTVIGDTACPFIDRHCVGNSTSVIVLP